MAAKKHLDPEKVMEAFIAHRGDLAQTAKALGVARSSVAAIVAGPRGQEILTEWRRAHFLGATTAYADAARVAWGVLVSQCEDVTTPPRVRKEAAVEVIRFAIQLDGVEPAAVAEPVQDIEALREQVAAIAAAAIPEEPPPGDDAI